MQKLTESLQGPASPGQSVAFGEPSGSTGLETMVFSPLVSAQVGRTGPAAPQGQGRAQGILGLWGTRFPGCRGFWDCGEQGPWEQGILGLWGTRALGAGGSGTVEALVNPLLHFKAFEGVQTQGTSA